MTSDLQLLWTSRETLNFLCTIYRPILIVIAFILVKLWRGGGGGADFSTPLHACYHFFPGYC